MPKGKLGSSIRAVLDSLYSIPKMTVKGAQITHAVDKTSRKSRGTLRLKIEVDRDKKQSKPNSGDNYLSLSLVLGTYERRMLLAQSEVSISRGGSRTIDKEIEFDWDTANADGGEGGGSVILGLLLDSIRGMDSEIVIGL